MQRYIQVGIAIAVDQTVKFDVGCMDTESYGYMHAVIPIANCLIHHAGELCMARFDHEGS